MGRTLLTSTQLVDSTKADWKSFRRALRKDDQIIFDELFNLSKKHIQAIANSDTVYPLEAIMLAAMIEQQRKIKKIYEYFRQEGILVEESLFD